MSAVEEPSAAGAPENENEATQEELDRLRAERDALAVKLDRRAERKARGGRIRQAVVLVMVALTIVLIPLTATVTWAHQTRFQHDPLGTDGGAARVGPCDHQRGLHPRSWIRSTRRWTRSRRSRKR